MSRIIVSFRRHSKPDKDPKTGASLDSLCEEGHIQAREEGAKLSYSDVIGYYSGLVRAEQTLDGIYAGSNITGAPKEISDFLKPISIDKEKTMFKALKDGNGNPRDATGLANYLLDSSNLQPTDETMYQAGERLYNHLMLVLDRAVQDYSGKDTLYVENITHAPVADGGLLYLYKLSTGQEVTDISTIGGGFDPCNNYIVEANIDGGKLGSTLKVKYKGYEFEIDMKKASANFSGSNLELAVSESAVESVDGNADTSEGAA